MHFGLALAVIAVVPLVMGVVYLIARFVPADSWFGVLAVLGIVPVFALAGSRVLTAWWHVLLAAAGAGLVAGVLCIPHLLYTDLRKAIEALKAAERQSENPEQRRPRSPQ